MSRRRVRDDRGDHGPAGAGLEMGEASWRRAPGSNPAEPLVEFAVVRGADGEVYVALREAAAPEGPVQVYTRAEWEAFVGGINDGDFDERY